MASGGRSRQVLSRRNFIAASAAGAATAGAAAVPGTAAAAVRAGGRSLAGRPGAAAAMVFVNNAGYDAVGPKRAVVGAGTPDLAAGTSFDVLDAATGSSEYSGRLAVAGQVQDWAASHYPDLPAYFWVADFSALARPGEYVVRVSEPGPAGEQQLDTPERALPVGYSFPFRVEDYVLERYTLSDVIHYFKGSRDSGQYAKNDRHLPMGPGSTQYIDAHGGWYDATGDYGIHFAGELSTTYMVTTQVPLTAYLCLESYQQLNGRPAGPLTQPDVPGTDFTALTTWLADEGLYGADFLVRMRIPGGSFYSGVNQPGVAKDPAQRTLSTTAVSFRGGAGQAIAALARASTFGISGDYSSTDYLNAAAGAYGYLAAYNTDLNSDHQENLTDSYDALLAATELYRATGTAAYKSDAAARAAQISDRLTSWQQFRDYWRAGADGRPFFNPANAGLPVVALLQYAGIAGSAGAQKVLQIVRRSLEFELAVTGQVTNPFGYARQLVQNAAGKRYAGFFMPHDAGSPEHSLNDIWWQGENARLGSLAAAARLAARRFAASDPAFAAELGSYAQHQLDWILGVNPFALCMLGGTGANNPQYIYLGSWRFQPQAGGIVNGITGKADDGSGIEWNLGFSVLSTEPGVAVADQDSDWRWKEQWLPHAAWYMYAVAIGNARL